MSKTMTPRATVCTYSQTASAPRPVEDASRVAARARWILTRRPVALTCLRRNVVEPDPCMHLGQRVATGCPGHCARASRVCKLRRIGDEDSTPRPSSRVLQLSQHRSSLPLPGTNEFKCLVPGPKCPYRSHAGLAQGDSLKA
jgi:hypothetical protein